MGVMGKQAPASQAPQSHVLSCFFSLQIDSKKELPNNDDDDSITLLGKILTSVKIQGSSPMGLKCSHLRGVGLHQTSWSPIIMGV